MSIIRITKSFKKFSSKSCFILQFYSNPHHEMQLQDDIEAKKQRFAQKFEESEANYSEQGGDDQHTSQGKPVQLIRISPSGKIEICQDALQIIAAYDEPVGFVSLVGKTRIGKSCLLNKILRLGGDGFRVDTSTQSCTQGIWMWSQPFLNPQFKNYVFFLDTEGTDSLTKDAQNDTKIFTLALLLSSYFIYNSKGSIDEQALSELQMVSALSKYIQVDDESNSANNNNQIHRFMPKFLWLLRDFMLQIENKYGKRISPSQYLQNCLNDHSSSSKNTQQSKKIKKSIINYFPNRECLTLVRPVDEEDYLQHLNELPQYRVRRQFTEGVNILRGKIMNNTGPKLYEGKPITGINFVVMIQSYVNAFNDKKVPNIKSAWEQIAQDEGNIAYNKALQRFQVILNKQLGSQPKGEQIYSIIYQLKDQTIKQFQSNCYNNKNEEYLSKLRQFLKQKQTQILQQNNKMNESRNIQILFTYSQRLKSKIESNYYIANKANKQQLQKDIKQVTDRYNQEAKGTSKGEIITQFITTLAPMIASMKADHSQAEKNAKDIQAAMEQQKKRIKKLEQQKQKRENQLFEKQKTSKLKKPISKVGSSKQKQKPIRDPGCCAGGNCQVM